MQASQPTRGEKEDHDQNDLALKKVSGRAFRTLAEREFKFQGAVLALSSP